MKYIVSFVLVALLGVLVTLLGKKKKEEWVFHCGLTLTIQGLVSLMLYIILVIVLA